MEQQPKQQPKYLERLILRNHESWIDGVFDFHKGVNILVGLSDAGKSSVLRAIRLVVDNEPNKNKESGEPVFKSDSAALNEDASVMLTFADSVSIARIKGKVTNQYDLTIAEGKTQEFKAFASVIPDEINNAIRLNEVNIQKQKELPFLLSQNSADRGRFFNQVAGLDNIDKSQKYANSKVLEAGREASTCGKEVERVGAELKKLDFIPALEKKVVELEALGGAQAVLEQRISIIKNTLNAHAKIEEQIEELPDASVLLPLENLIEFTNGLINTYEEREIRLKTLEGLCNKWNVLKDDIREAEDIDTEGLSKTIKSTLQLIADYTDKRRHLSVIKSYADSYALVLQNIKSTEKQLVKASAEFTELKPETCPMCGGEW